MEQRQILPPRAEELQAYSLGKCQPQRAGEIESFLAGGPDCSLILGAAPEDTLVRHLRGAGELPQGGSASPPAGALPGLFGAAESTETASSSRTTSPAGELGADATALLEHPRYRLIRKLGQGGMGTVYLAQHRLMRRLVAIKLIRAGCLDNPQLVQRFLQEVEAAARLSHPHIVTAHDADEFAGTHFLVMEFVEGESLDQLARQGPLPVAEACAYVRQAALGLDFAHGKGLVHRDVKPHNLMRTADGTVKVLDFGLARVLREAARPEDPLTSTGAVMGTVDYLAPEQARDSRSADVRADVYSLGCTLYQLLSGHVPYPGGTAIDKIIRHATAQPEPLCGCRVDLPAGLARVVEKMMARRPADRYQTLAEVAAALEPFTHPNSQGPSATITASRPGKLPSRWRPRGRLLAAVLAATLLIGGGLIAVTISRTGAGTGAAAGKAPGPAPIELIRRIPVAAVGDRFYDTAVSGGGKYALVTRDLGAGARLDVFNVATGHRTFACPGYAAQFLNPEQLVVEAEGKFRVLEARSGKLLREGSHRAFWGLIVAPGGKHLVYNGPGGVYLYDLVAMKELQAWAGKAAGYSTLFFSPDGKRLICRFAGEPWTGWDVENNRPARDLGGLEGVSWVHYLYPDGKTAAVGRPGPRVRIDLHTGRVVEARADLNSPSGAIQSRFSRSWRRYLVRLVDGWLLVYCVPPGGKELGRFQLPPDDRAVWPGRGACRWEVLSEDDRYAALLTTQALYVLRLPNPRGGNPD